MANAAAVVSGVLLYVYLYVYLVIVHSGLIFSWNISHIFCWKFHIPAESSYCESSSAGQLLPSAPKNPPCVSQDSNPSPPDFPTQPSPALYQHYYTAQLMLQCRTASDLYSIFSFFVLRQSRLLQMLTQPCSSPCQVERLTWFSL